MSSSKSRAEKIYASVASAARAGVFIGTTALAFFSIPALSGAGFVGFIGACMIGSTTAALATLASIPGMIAGGIVGAAAGAAMGEPRRGARVGASISGLAAFALATASAYGFSTDVVVNGFENRNQEASQTTEQTSNLTELNAASDFAYASEKVTPMTVANAKPVSYTNAMKAAA